MPNLKWSNLSHLQLGQYAEYYAKMEFASYGFEVYTSEVDDHGVDFVVKNEAGKFLEVQVKSVRDRNYTFIKKSKMVLDDNHLVCYLLFDDEKLPGCYLFPATVWKVPDGSLFSYKDYEDAEFGINASKKNQDKLDMFRFEDNIQRYRN